MRGKRNSRIAVYCGTGVKQLIDVKSETPSPFSWYDEILGFVLLTCNHLTVSS